MYEVVDFIAQNPVGPRGADFGKGSPIGLFMLVLLLLVVLLVGWDLSRRLKRQRIRRVYAEKHGIDPFDIKKIDESIQEDVRNRRAGVSATAAASASATSSAASSESAVAADSVDAGGPAEAGGPGTGEPEDPRDEGPTAGR